MFTNAKNLPRILFHIGSDDWDLRKIPRRTGFALKQLTFSIN